MTAAKLRPQFWNRHKLGDLSKAEWEALCDGCGKCCLNKLEDEDTAEVALTRVACRLLDNETCRCSKYETRHRYVPECIVLTPSTLKKNLYWLPQTCAYKLLYQGNDLPDWHPLLTGDPDSPHTAGVGMRGQTLSEVEVADDDWEDYIIDEPI